MPNPETQQEKYLRYQMNEAISIGNMSRPRAEGDPEDGPDSVALVVVTGKTVQVKPEYVEEFERRHKALLKRGGGLKRVKHEDRPEEDDDESEGPVATPGSPARGAAASRTSGRSMASQPSEVTNPVGSSTEGGS